MLPVSDLLVPAAVQPPGLCIQQLPVLRKVTPALHWLCWVLTDSAGSSGLQLSWCQQQSVCRRQLKVRNYEHHADISITSTGRWLHLVKENVREVSKRATLGLSVGLLQLMHWGVTRQSSNFKWWKTFWSVSVRQTHCLTPKREKHNVYLVLNGLEVTTELKMLILMQSTSKV